MPLGGYGPCPNRGQIAHKNPLVFPGNWRSLQRKNLNFPLTLQSVYSTIIKRLQRVHYAMMREIARENEVTSAEYVRESGG